MSSEIQDLYLNVNRLKILSYSIKDSIFGLDANKENISLNNQNSKFFQSIGFNERQSIIDQNSTYVLEDIFEPPQSRKKSIESWYETNQEIHESKFGNQQLEKQSQYFKCPYCKTNSNRSSIHLKPDLESNQFEKNEYEQLKIKFEEISVDNSIITQDLQESLHLNSFLVEQIKELKKNLKNVELLDVYKQKIEEQERNYSTLNDRYQNLKLKLEKLVELVKIELEDQIADQIENEGFIQKIMSENATLRELLQISKFNEEDYEKFKKEIDSVAIKLESEYFDEQSTKNHLQRQQDKFNLERFDKIIAGLSEKKYRKSDNPREEFHQSEIVNKEIPGKQKAFDIPGDKTKSSITKIARNKFFNEKFENNEDIKYKNDTDLIALTSKELQNLHIDDDDDDEDDIGLKNYNMKLDIDDIDDLEDDDEDEY